MENKLQLFIIIGAVAAGIVAVVLTGNYVNTTVNDKSKALAEKYANWQKEKDAEAQQAMQKTEQQMGLLADEVERLKNEQAAAIQKQMAAFQQEQARMQAQQQQPPKKIEHGSLALKIPEGKRAVTVTIDSLAAVGGLINSGDFVDVIAQLNLPSGVGDKKTVTAMIFQDLQVLAVNTSIENPGSYEDQQASSSLKITFAVDPQEAGLLAFADKNGTLELALRSPDEKNRQKTKASTWKTLADYVLKEQGLNIQNPDEEGSNKPAGAKQNIQIFRHGQEL